MKRIAKHFATLGALAALLAGAVPEASAQRPFIILSNGQRIEADSIRARPTGDVVVASSGVTREFTRAQIQRAVGEKPAEQDQAMAHLQAGRFAEAIPLFEKIARDARWLDWDRLALEGLARAQVGSGDAAAGIRSYNELFQRYPEARDGEAKWGLLQALLAQKDIATLENELDQVVKSGSRPDAARAQIMRGDIRSSLGDHEGAAIEYLRTVVFFKNVDAMMPQAHLKAGQALKQMRDPRAKDQFQQVIQRYGNTPEAARARAEM